MMHLLLLTQLFFVRGEGAERRVTRLPTLPGARCSAHVCSFLYAADVRGVCQHGLNIIGAQLMPWHKQVGQYGTGGFVSSGVSGRVTRAPDNLLSFPFLKPKL